MWIVVTTWLSSTPRRFVSPARRWPTASTPATPVIPEADAHYIYSQRLVLVTGIANDAQRMRDVKKVDDKVKQRLFYVPVQATFLTPEEETAFTEFLLDRLGAPQE